MRDLLQEFINTKMVEAGVSTNTAQSYKTDISLYIEAIKPILPEQAKTEDIERYLNKIRNSEYEARTMARKISAIREYYKFLQSENIIVENPANKIRTPKIGKSLPSFLTPDEVKKMCDVALIKKNFCSLRTAVMIKLMFASGLRVSEIVSLPEGAINFDLCQVLIFGKGSKERIVPISKDVKEDILNYWKCRETFLGKRRSKWFFPSLRSLSGHITRAGFFKNLKKTAELAGLDASKVHPHILRHSFATNLINNHADLRSVQKMLGHESIATTEIYTHVTTEKIAQEVMLHHPLMQQQKREKS